MRHRKALLATLVAMIPAAFAHAQTFKSEPPPGSLKPGEVILVDDGTCPKGKIKQVVGGDHKKVGGKAEVVRRRSCVNR